jgi:hypothetical protein
MRNEWVSEWCEALWLRFGDPTLSFKTVSGAWRTAAFS